jgi:putative glutamine amidotransferase
MPEAPLIGLPSARKTCDNATGWQITAPPSYVRAVEGAGGLPLIVPISLDESTLRAVYARLDGVLLLGGGDVCADAYGMETLGAMAGQDAVRDSAESALARWAVADDKPIFAICRGIQVLNVALGGTLYRDIPGEYDTTIRHSNDFTKDRHTPAHTVDVAEGSTLHAALGLSELTVGVNSFHHQAVRQVAEGMAVVARAPDGLIEGLEHPGRRFVVGVQWHPEEMVDTAAPMQHLFESFVQAAAR